MLIKSHACLHQLFHPHQGEFVITTLTNIYVYIDLDVIHIHIDTPSRQASTRLAHVDACFNCDREARDGAGAAVPWIKA